MQLQKALPALRPLRAIILRIGLPQVGHMGEFAPHEQSILLVNDLTCKVPKRLCASSDFDVLDEQMTSKETTNLPNESPKPLFCPLYIYNIKKSLSIIYTEENPSQGNPPHQFDDVELSFRSGEKICDLRN